MPRLPSSPPQTPAGGFPAEGADAQVSPAAGPRGCQLDWSEDAEHCMLVYSAGLLRFLRCPPELCEL